MSGMQIKQKLTGWLGRPVAKDGAAFALFLRNKIAQLTVYIVQVQGSCPSCTVTYSALSLMPFAPSCGDSGVLSSCPVLMLSATCCLQVEYPKEWPSFFHELLAMLPEGPQAVDMFCRILVAVDQDVVSLDIPRLFLLQRETPIQQASHR